MFKQFNLSIKIISTLSLIFCYLLFLNPSAVDAQSCRTSADCIGITISTGLTCPAIGATYNRCDCIGGLCVKQPDGLRGDFVGPSALGTIVSRLYLIVVVPIGSIGFIFFLISGYQFLMSKGDPKALQAAKARLTYSIIGLIIVFLAAAATSYIFGVFNLFSPVQ